MSGHRNTQNSKAQDNSPEFRVSFRVLGKKLDLDRISTEFGITPSRSHRSGETDILQGKFDQDMWLIESPLGREVEFDKHFEWLKQIFGSRLAVVRRLAKDFDVSIICNYRTYNSDQGGFSLSPASLSIGNEMGVRIEFHFLFI